MIIEYLKSQNLDFTCNTALTEVSIVHPGYPLAFRNAKLHSIFQANDRFKILSMWFDLPHGLKMGGGDGIAQITLRDTGYSGPLAVMPIGEDGCIFVSHQAIEYDLGVWCNVRDFVGGFHICLDSFSEATVDMTSCPAALNGENLEAYLYLKIQHMEQLYLL